MVDPTGDSTVAGELFIEAEVCWYRWEHTYRTADAVGLLSTYSPYLALPPDPRAALLEGIEALINDRFGGAVTRRYLAILTVAGRRGAER